MNKFTEMWVNQLRAGALQIAKQADEIIGDLDMNRELSVTIRLTPGDGTMKTPVIEIYREIFSKPMFDVIAHKDQQAKRDAEWAEMMNIMMRQAREAEVTNNETHN